MSSGIFAKSSRVFVLESRKKMFRRIVFHIFRLKALLSRVFGVRRLDYPGAELKIYTDTFREYDTRAKSCSKEPETVEWIEEHLREGSVFYDIGANIGAYSLIAASKGARVFAFEPAYPNFYQLCRNTSLNNFDSRITCLPIILADKIQLGIFDYLETSTGTSRCYYHDEYSSHSEANSKVATKKAALVYTLDELIRIFELPSPNLIKIDVDGAEAAIVRGASKTLQMPSLKTVLVEVDGSRAEAKELHQRLSETSFVVKGKYKRSGQISNVIFEKTGLEISNTKPELTFSPRVSDSYQGEDYALLKQREN